MGDDRTTWNYKKFHRAKETNCEPKYHVINLINKLETAEWNGIDSAKKYNRIGGKPRVVTVNEEKIRQRD